MSKIPSKFDGKVYFYWSVAHKDIQPMLNDNLTGCGGYIYLGCKDVTCVLDNVAATQEVIEQLEKKREETRNTMLYALDSISQEIDSYLALEHTTGTTDTKDNQTEEPPKYDDDIPF